MIVLAWLWFAVVQLVSLVAMVAGWFLLIVPAVLNQWEPEPSPFPPPHYIQQWSWHWLNPVYGNPEDGVTGRPDYLPTWPLWARCYVWSAWRNSADNLKYVFAWAHGPFVTFTIFGRQFRAGWQIENGINVPVISI